MKCREADEKDDKEDQICRSEDYDPIYPSRYIESALHTGPCGRR